MLRLVIYEERGTQNCRKELRNLLYRLRVRDGVNNRKTFDRTCICAVFVGR